MAVHPILSEQELQTAAVGLYYVATKDGTTLEESRSIYDVRRDEWLKDVPARLMARVRDGASTEKPVGVEGITARADGKEIITAWVPVALIDAADSPPTEEPPATVEPEATPVPVIDSPTCPSCAAVLGQQTIRNIAVCACGRSVVLVFDADLNRTVARLATVTDTRPLSEADILTLKKQRPKR